MIPTALLPLAGAALVLGAVLIVRGTVQHRRFLRRGGRDRGVGLIIAGAGLVMLLILEALDLWLDL